MEILQGIVIGVFTGLTLGSLTWMQNRFVRCDQITYIRKLIIKERKTIYSATDLFDPISIPRDAVRFTVYRGMRKDLFAALEKRASQLSFDEKTSITNECQPIDWLLGQIRQDQAPPFQMYTKMFSEWEKCAWLNLPAYDGEIPAQ